MFSVNLEEEQCLGYESQYFICGILTVVVSSPDYVLSSDRKKLNEELEVIVA